MFFGLGKNITVQRQMSEYLSLRSVKSFWTELNYPSYLITECPQGTISMDAFKLIKEIKC